MAKGGTPSQVRTRVPQPGQDRCPLPGLGYPPLRQNSRASTLLRGGWHASCVHAELCWSIEELYFYPRDLELNLKDQYQIQNKTDYRERSIIIRLLLEIASATL